jgi:isoquinoline 1-oxidoreductase beta subunit
MAKDQVFDSIAYRPVSRRAFLVTGGATAIGVAFGSVLTAKKAHAQAASFSPNAWVVVAANGTVTVYSPAAEMGQGVMTAMPLLIAEEMDLDWSRVRVEQAPFVMRDFGNPMFGGGMITGASRTTRGYYELMRIAGMQARYVMMVAAARRWNVPALEVSTEPHKVLHKASNRSLDYGEIATFAAAPAGMPEYKRDHLKPASQFRLVGKDVPRVDGFDKATGRAKYGIDTRMGGLLYGAVLRPPVQGEKATSVDDAAAKAMPGVVAVVPMPWGVGVVADSYPTAMKAKAALKVNWSTSAAGRGYTSEKLIEEYTKRAHNLADGGVEYVKVGDPKAAISGAAKVISADYASYNVAQTPMEPMNATALVVGDAIEVWAPMQAPTIAFVLVTKGLGFAADKVRLNTTLLGGGFGRRVDADYVLDAGFLARAVPGRPVKVVWSREDDIRYVKFRPLVVQRLIAGVDSGGNLVALHHRVVSESIYARANPPLFQKAGGRDQPVCEGAEHITYGVPNRVLDYLREQRGLDAGFWRGVGPGYTKFAIETLMDELAAAAGKDPVAYRVALLGTQPRAKAVIEEAARMAKWGTKRPAGRALGIAYSDAWDTHIAQVAEVSVDRKSGRIRVHEVWCAVDCGVVLQPKNVLAQIESGIVFGISAALKEKLSFKDGQALQSNFHDYRILRMNETPKISVNVMVNANAPGGVGEAGLPPIAPAIANAVTVLTGKRLRQLPLQEELLKA